jgi:hypothetical protein
VTLVIILGLHYNEYAAHHICFTPFIYDPQSKPHDYILVVSISTHAHFLELGTLPDNSGQYLFPACGRVLLYRSCVHPTNAKDEFSESSNQIHPCPFQTAKGTSSIEEARLPVKRKECIYQIVPINQTWIAPFCRVVTIGLYELHADRLTVFTVLLERMQNLFGAS